MGTCRARVKYNDIAYNIALVVVTGEDKTSLLGSRASKLMGLVKKSHHVRVHTVITDTKSRIRRTWMSARQTPRTAERKCCPISTCSTTRVVCSERKTELHRLEKMGIIRRTEEPTDLINAPVIVEQYNGSFRLCLDPKDLNARD